MTSVAVAVKPEERVTTRKPCLRGCEAPCQGHKKKERKGLHHEEEEIPLIYANRKKRVQWQIFIPSQNCNQY